MENLTHENDAKTQAAKKLKKQNFSGRVWLALGACLMLFSFGLNYLLFHGGGDFMWPMVVLTSLGAGCMLKSMADFFGF